MKTKEEIIKEAYGPDFEALKEYIDMETGKCSSKPTTYHMKRGVLGFLGLSWDPQQLWMPRGLSSNLDNYGWLPIKDFSPQVGEHYEFIDVNERYFVTKIHSLRNIDNLTAHLLLFKKINKSILPNYK